MSTPPRVLVVDDEAQVRLLVSLAFELEGFEVAVATDGEEAVTEAARFGPDAVILDIMMPKVDGLTALLDLRSQAETADVPVLLLSAKAHTADITIGMRAGAADYLTKPFDTEDLVARTRLAIDRATAPA
jgi:two-component system OmpR family response regulator